MEAAAASTEITVLIWSVVLLLAQIVAQALSIYDFGPKYLLGSRDEDRQPKTVIAGRLHRALTNLLETYPAFIALVLALGVTGKTGGIAATGAWVWLAARVVYVPIYAAGIPVLRTLTWCVSIVGLLMMLARLVV
jgi:uncharacterized MAPEG superfamily protein